MSKEPVKTVQGITIGLHDPEHCAKFGIVVPNQIIKNNTFTTPSGIKQVDGLAPDKLPAKKPETK